MRKRLLCIVMVLLSLTLLLGGCGEKTGQEWLCTVDIPKNSDEIVIWDTTVQTTSGELSIQNHADVAIRWFLFNAEDEANDVRMLDIGAGGVGTMKELDAEVTYRVGIQAKVTDAREIEVLLSEYPSQKPYDVK